MDKGALSGREAWQDASGAKALDAELSFLAVFQRVFEGTEFSVVARPKDLVSVYVDFPLSRKTLSEIYRPPDPVTKHGIFPDYAILHARSRKVLYVEVKRQDGWVEGKSRAAERGNAHERCCKYFTPGLLKILRQKSRIKGALPFWVVFQGDITRDPCRVREIACWFDRHEGHYFFWRDPRDPRPLVARFERRLKHLLR